MVTENFPIECNGGGGGVHSAPASNSHMTDEECLVEMVEALHNATGSGGDTNKYITNAK